MRTHFALCSFLFFVFYNNAQPTKSFFVVHADPLEPNGVVFSDLVDLVDTANYFDVKLTLEFSKPWCDTIISSAGYMSLVRQWQLQGHEIAAHHHDYLHPDWDGYSNTSDHPIHPSFINYIGDMSDLYAVTDLVCGDSLCLTTGTGPDSLESATDYYSRWIYKTHGGVDEANAFSTISQELFGTYEICEIGYTYLASPLDFAGIQSLFDASTEMHCGVVTHVWNWAENKPLYVNWFNYITGKTPGQCKTVRELMRESDCTLSSVGLNNAGKDQEAVLLFPNPADDWIKIKFSKSIRILDSQGRLVFSKYNLPEEYIVDTSQFDPNVYFVLLDGKSWKLIIK